MMNEIRPGDDGYDDLLALWRQDGEGRQIDIRFQERIYQVIFPDGSPVFVLMAYLPGITTQDKNGPVSGTAAAMSTWQRTWHGNRKLPK